MSEPLEGILSIIDSQYSRKYHLGMLKFLAQSVVPHGQLMSCEGVPEVYRAIKQKCSNDGIAVALLRHMLRVTGYKKQKELQSLDAHCAKEFSCSLNTVAPSLAFYELLLLLAKKLHKNSNYKPFLDCIDEKKLNKSKHDVLSPLDLLQSMLHKRTIGPDNHHSLRDELIVPLKSAGLMSEAQFMERSIQSLESQNEENSIGVAVYFSFDGQFQQPSSPLSGTCMQQVSDETIEALCADRYEETDSLLRPTHRNGSTCSSLLQVLLKRKRSCIGIISPLLIVSLVAFVVFAISGAFPVERQTQSVYGNLVYSPLAINHFVYASVGVSVRIDIKEDLNNYNLTICQTECSLKTRTKYYNVSNGSCPTDRPLSNCFAQLDELMHDYPGADEQSFSIYLLKGSKITFRITELNTDSEDVQLCITTEKSACYKAFASIGNSDMLCHKLVTFNKANNYTQTFLADDDSYYCAVWLLESNDYWINYSTNSSIQVFNMSDFYSPHQCQSFQKHPNIIFTLRGRPKWETVCIVMEENSNSLHDNITMVSTTDKRLSDCISVPFSVFSGLLTALALCAIIIIFLALFSHSPIIHRCVSS